MCKHLWMFGVFGHLIIRKCQLCGKTEYKTHPDDEWTEVQDESVPGGSVHR